MKFNKRICAGAPSFDLETEVYPGPFTPDIQAQVKQHPARRQSIHPVQRTLSGMQRSNMPSTKNRSPLSAHRDSSRHMITRD
jgi:hypothetical protein